MLYLLINVVIVLLITVHLFLKLLLIDVAIFFG